jgi:predicted transcriptional regulator
MSQKPRTTESCHIRIEKDLHARIQTFAETTNRTLNNAFETLLYDAIEFWEQEQVAEQEQGQG